MQSNLKKLLGGVGFVFCFLVSVWPVAAQNATHDHAQIYKGPYLRLIMPKKS